MEAPLAARIGFAEAVLCSAWLGPMVPPTPGRADETRVYIEASVLHTWRRWAGKTMARNAGGAVR